MTHSEKNTGQPTTISNELKAEQTLGLIGLGLMQKISRDGEPNWLWSETEDSEKADLLALRQRLELTALAIETGAPLTTSEVTHLLGAKPGSSKAERGGLVAKRLSRNVWKLNRLESDSSYWRN